MVGPLIYGFSEDAVAAAKVIADFAKGNDKLVIKGGAYAGKALDANGVKALASIPSREVLIAGGRPAEVADPAHGRRAGPSLAARGRPRHLPKPKPPPPDDNCIAFQTFNRFRGNPNGIRQRRIPDRPGQHVRDGTQRPGQGHRREVRRVRRRMAAPAAGGGGAAAAVVEEKTEFNVCCWKPAPTRCRSSRPCAN
jgi:hypothetical protein